LEKRSDRMKVKIIKISDEYSSCSGCFSRAKYKIIVKYGRGERNEDTFYVCKRHLNQTILYCRKFLEVVKRLKE